MSNTKCRPVFIVGAQRSGTTMLRLMLNAHPRFAVPFESDFLAPLARGLVPATFATPDAARAALDALAEEKFTRKAGLVEDKAALLNRPIHTYAELLDAVFGEHARTRGKPCWGIKTPGYATRIDEIHQLFPGARLVHIVRDGRDVALSNRRISWGTSHTPIIAHDWRWQVLTGRKCGRMLGGNYFELRYEDLVRDSERTLRRLCEFLNEPFDPAMLRYHESAANEMPQDSLQWHQNSISAPRAEKVFEWRSALPVADQVLFQEIAGDALDAFGYERVPQGARIRTGFKRAYYALVRRW